MTQTVVGPEGDQFQFPDDTPAAEITAAMDAHYSQPQQPAYVDASRAGASGALHSAAQAPGMLGDMLNLAGAGLADAAKRARPLLGKVGIDLPPDAYIDYAGKFAGTGGRYAATAAMAPGLAGQPAPTSADMETSARAAGLPAEYTGETPAGQISNFAGHFAPAALGGGGLVGALARVGGSAAGSKSAQTLAANFGANDTEQQLAAALGAGGGFKAAGLAGPLTRPVDSALAVPVKAAGRLLDRAQVDPNKLGVFGGNVTLGPQGATPPPTPAPINRSLVSRGRVTPERFQQTLAPYEAQGIEPFEFQGYGPQAGVAKLAALSRMPGETGTLARETIDPARADLQTRALSALDQMSGGKTRFQATQDLEGAKQSINAQYDPILTQPLDPSHETAIGDLMGRLPDQSQSDVVQIMKELHQSDPQRADSMSPGQRLQLMKRGLYYHIQGLPEDGFGPARKSIAGKVYSDFAQKMDDAFPGYGAVDQQYADVQRAFDALGRLNPDGSIKKIGLGSTALANGPGSLSKQEVAAQFGGLPPVAQDAYGTAAAHTLGQQIEGKAEGYNPGIIAGSPAAQAKLGTIFGDKAQPFIDSQRLIRKDAGDYNLVSPDRQSQTAGMSAQMMDEMLRNQKMIKGGPLGWVENLMDAGVSRVANPLFEQHHNALGAQLLERITPDRKAQILKQLQDIQGEKQRAALAQALAAQTGGAQPQQQPGAQP